MPQINYLSPSFMNAIARQQMENLEAAWNKSNDGEITTSSGCESDRKKAAAQSKIKNLIDQKSSKVVHVKGLESEEITNEIIASLFSNFGNINKVLFLRKKHTALVEYHDMDSASVAKEMLNNLTFFGSQLKVCYSTYASVAENLATSNNPEKFKDVYSPSPKTYRFKEYKKISINPPSKILHLSNIAREVFTDKALTEIFSENATVKKVKLLNLGDEEKCMALIELASLESALACISTLHNRVFFSR
jgi:polypyrimidine tract-binding protein 2